ncbi:MAG: leucyl/phenylalanyl-tRNA--protein transferase [Pyrinomonadaceae bacterium]
MSFPDPRQYDFPEWILIGEYFYRADDIVAFDVPLTVENLKDAYRQGIFPWHIDGVPLPWFCPEQRAVLDLDDLHIPRSLAKERRKNRFTFTIDRAFGEVIEACSNAKRSDQPGGGTWITAEFKRAYRELHAEGSAHSIEAWDADGGLAGGLYGVDAGGVFCGESMFYKSPNSSKLALLYLIEHLRERGATWIDIQVMTPHMQALGAREISREEFLDRLCETQARGLDLFSERSKAADAAEF